MTVADKVDLGARYQFSALVLSEHLEALLTGRASQITNVHVVSEIGELLTQAQSAALDQVEEPLRDICSLRLVSDSLPPADDHLPRINELIGLTTSLRSLREISVSRRPVYETYKAFLGRLAENGSTSAGCMGQMPSAYTYLL